LSHPLLSTTLNQLEQWFGGKRQEFDLPLMPSTSEEAARLRAAIASVGFGTTLTYGALADQIGSAARAIGQACKTNPFPIIIPCHRIVSASGPEFYSGGAGPKTKTWLLDFEYAKLPDLQKHRLL
jgi:methylated-DNA-[protein]-cysteine S-methyltransferase